MNVGRLPSIGRLCVVLICLLCSAAACAADAYPEIVKAPAFPVLPAVDGLNAKAAGFGGGADGRALYGSEGSISVPLGFRYGFQLDGLVSGYDNPSQGRVTTTATAGHLCWRDPAVGLVGAYAHYFHADAFRGVNYYAGAAEGALYWGRFSLDGLAGVEAGKVNLGAFGSVDIATRFFDIATLSYYPTDNLKLSVGHSYVLGRHALLLGTEWGLHSGGGTMAALFAHGSVSEGGNAGVLAGLRIYFGQRDKTLIQRHREDDPPSRLPGSTGFGLVHMFGDILAINVKGTLEMINNTLYGS